MITEAISAAFSEGKTSVYSTLALISLAPATYVAVGNIVWVAVDPAFTQAASSPKIRQPISEKKLEDSSLTALLITIRNCESCIFSLSVFCIHAKIHLYAAASSLCGRKVPLVLLG